MNDLVSAVLAFGVQQSWQKEIEKVEKATLSLGLLLASAQEYHRFLLQVLLKNLPHPPEGVAVPIELQPGVIEEARKDQRLVDFFAFHRVHENAAIARFHSDDETIAELGRRLYFSVATVRYSLSEAAKQPNQVLTDASEQLRLCNGIEEEVIRAIKAARQRTRFLSFLMRPICWFCRLLLRKIC